MGIAVFGNNKQVFTHRWRELGIRREDGSCGCEGMVVNRVAQEPCVSKQRNGVAMRVSHPDRRTLIRVQLGNDCPSGCGYSQACTSFVTARENCFYCVRGTDRQDQWLASLRVAVISHALDCGRASLVEATVTPDDPHIRHVGWWNIIPSHCDRIPV